VAVANINQIIERLQAEQNKANKANETRYAELLASIAGLGQQVGGSYEQALQRVAGVGQTAYNRIGSQETRAQGMNQQDLISRGLANTTVVNTTRRGISSDAESARQGVDELVADRQAGVYERMAGSQLDIGRLLAQIMEGRNDLGPDLGLYSSLISQAQASKPMTLKVGAGSVNASQHSMKSPSGGGGGGTAPGSTVTNTTGQGGIHSDISRIANPASSGSSSSQASSGTVYQSPASTPLWNFAFG
jgi:hypothetical protein